MPEEELLQRPINGNCSTEGLSGRTAQQFIDYLSGAKALPAGSSEERKDAE